MNRSINKGSLKKQITSGIIWGGFERVTQQVIQFGLSVLLARLLSPDDFGMMAMMMVFTGFAGMLADGGFNTALVQKQDMTDAHVHTVFWITLFSGTFLAIITFLSAPLLAKFYKTPALEPIFQVISVNFILGSFGNVPSALLQKQMRFSSIAKINNSALVISGTVAVVMALRGAGVWSLVAQSIISAFILACLRIWSCRWLPKFVFSLRALREILSFSGHMFGFLFINYWARNADNLIVGKFFGSATLGVYSRAYALMLLPLTQFNAVINQIMLPALSMIQNDKPRARSLYLRTVGIVSLLSSPLMFGLFVVAKPFILTIYGEKWVEVAPILQVLSLVGWIQSLTSSGGLLLQSQGRSGRLFYWWSLFYTMFVASFFVGVMIGTVYAVAVCYAVANLLYVYPAMSICGRVVDLDATDILKAASGPVYSALGMSAIVYAVQCSLPTSWPTGLALVILVLVGMSAYLTTVIVFDLIAWQDLSKIVREKMSRKLG